MMAAMVSSAGTRAFDVMESALRQSVEEQTSTSTDPRRDTQALSLALHGIVTLVPAVPGFDWTPLEDLITSLAHLKIATGR
jgi:hypothetical protein